MTEEEKIAMRPAGDEGRTNFYRGISKINADDHHEIKRAKNKLNQLLEQELDFLGFQDELTEEERADLLDSTMSEVREKSSFFYKYDANKVNTNKAI